MNYPVATLSIRAKCLTAKPLVNTNNTCFTGTTEVAATKSFQSCPTLCDPTDSSPPGSPVPGILQARTLEWVAISFSNAWMWKVKVKSLSRVRLLVTPWTAAHQAPLSMGFSRQEYWSGVPLPSLTTEVKTLYNAFNNTSMGSHRVGHDWSNLAAAAAAP